MASSIESGVINSLVCGTDVDKSTKTTTYARVCSVFRTVFRTVSNYAVVAIAGLLPMHVLAEELLIIYNANPIVI